jgi:hypothetical protein
MPRPIDKTGMAGIGAGGRRRRSEEFGLSTHSLIGMHAPIAFRREASGINTPAGRRGSGGQLGWLFEGRPVAAVAEKNEVLLGNLVEDCDRDLERRHPIVAPWIGRTGVLLPDRSGGRMRVYAGMRTFISVMPWIRFE